MKTVQQRYRKSAVNISFNKAVIDAVDEGLSILGESVKRSLYLYLERFYNIQKEEIPVKITDFVEALEEIFGLGSNLLLLQIMKSLHRRFRAQIKLCDSSLDFVKYVKAKEAVVTEITY